MEQNVSLSVFLKKKSKLYPSIDYIRLLSNIGGFLTDILLPDENIEVTQLLPRKQCENWCLNVNNILCMESTKLFPEDPYESIENGDKLSFSTPLAKSKSKAKSINMESVEFSIKLDFVMATVGHDRFKLSPNNLSSLFLSAIFEEFNERVGKKNLLKRSFLLIKIWCSYEARKYCTTDLPDLFSHDALLVITLAVFSSKNQFHMSIEHPIRALRIFLEIMSEVDWRKQHITALGMEDSCNSLQNSYSGDRENAFHSSLENIIDAYRVRYEDNFTDHDLSFDQFGEADRGGGNGAQFGQGRVNIVGQMGSAVVGGSTTSLRRTNSNSSNNGSRTASQITVMDPVIPNRNLCAYKVHDPDILRHIFASGLHDLADLFHLSERSQSTTSKPMGEKEVNAANTFFPLSVEKAVILSDMESNNLDARHFQGLYSGATIIPPTNIVKRSSESTKYPEMFYSSIQQIVSIIRHSEMVCSTKVSAFILHI